MNRIPSKVVTLTGDPLAIHVVSKSVPYHPRIYSAVEENLDLVRKRYHWGRDSGSRRALASLQLFDLAGQLDALVAAGLDHTGRLHIFLTGESCDSLLIANGTPADWLALALPVTDAISGVDLRGLLGAAAGTCPRWRPCPPMAGRSGTPG